MSNFDDLAMAVASFGGNNAVKFDDLGMPSIMVGIPKMKYSDIITGGTQETLPWWIVDGVEKEVIWVSKYINVVVNDRAYSLPMKDPKAYIDFDTALAVCRRKGEGWHLNQNGVFAAINLWCMKNGFTPRGNTNWDRSYEKAYEKGVNTYVDGSHGGGRTATGSGPVTWNHDGSQAGIADLCGNCWEWVSGTLVAPGTVGTLKIDRTSASDATLRINTSVTTQTTDSNDTSVPFKDTKAVSGVTIPQILIASGLYPDAGQTTPGRFWARNNGERLPIRGSGFHYTSYGGAGALNLYYARSNVFNSVSLRSALYE